MTRLWFATDISPGLRLLGLALRPLALISRRVAMRRRQRMLLDHQLPPRPLIVVGNIVAGGAGKTPLVIAIARALNARGWHCGLLCGAYRGSSSGPMLVTRLSDPKEVGDEAVLLARSETGPVAAGAKRMAALQCLLSTHPEVDVVLSDDGLQHHALPRSLEIAVFDRRGTGNGRMLPAGPLREPLEHLATMDAVVLNGANAAPIQHGHIWLSQVEAIEFVNVSNPARRIPATDFADFAGASAVRAVAGIASPERFFEMLNELGIRAQSIALPDHAEITREHFRGMTAELAVMTEKDAVKCQSFGMNNLWWLRIAAQCDPDLINWLEDKLRGQATA